MSDGPIFLWDNTKFDAATLTASSEQADWPVENVQDGLRKKVWKTDGTGQATIQVDFTEAVTVSALGLVSFDLGTTATVTVTAYSDAYTTEIMSEEFEIYESLLGWGDGRWDLTGWDGYPTEDDLALLPRITRALLLASPTTARYWKVEFDNGSTEFYLGRLFLCDHWQAPPLADGATITLVDPSEREQSLGRQWWTNVKDPYYRAELDLKRMQEADRYAAWVQLSKLCGVHKDMIVRVVDWTDKQAFHTTLYGRLAKSPGAVMRSKYYETSYVIEEST